MRSWGSYINNYHFEVSRSEVDGLHLMGLHFTLRDKEFWKNFKKFKAMKIDMLIYIGKGITLKDGEIEVLCVYV